jgi:ABC-2 type transport system permease protein
MTQINKYLYFLQIEFEKYRYHNLSKVILGIFTLLFCFIILYAKEVVPNVSPPLPSVETFFEFPTVWDYQGQIGNWLVCIFLGFLVIQQGCQEFSYKTVRQSIINGWTKQDYFVSKFLVVITYATFATLIYAVSTLIYGVIHTSDLDFQIIFDSNYAIPRFWLMSFGYLSFANLLVFLIRRSGLTTIAYFGYIFIFEFLMRMLHLYYFKHRSILFYPINSIEDIMPNPLFKLPDFWMEKAWGFKPLLTYGEASISALIYSIVIVYLTWVIFKKRDI